VSIVRVIRRAPVMGLGDESVGIDIASPFGLRLNPPVGKGCRISAKLTR
jgi:hypothetical protein